MYLICLLFRICIFICLLLFLSFVLPKLMLNALIYGFLMNLRLETCESSFFKIFKIQFLLLRTLNLFSWKKYFYFFGFQRSSLLDANGAVFCIRGILLDLCVRNFLIA